MLAILEFAQDFIARLDRRAQRILLLVCCMAMTLFAGTTVSAAERGDVPDATAGGMLLALCVIGSAVVWSARRSSARQR